MVNVARAQSVYPLEYNIFVTTYIYPSEGGKEWTFDGEVNITVSSDVENTREVILHQHRLGIKSATMRLLRGGNGTEQEVGDSLISDDALSSDNDKQTITFKLRSPIQHEPRGTKYNLRISYFGNISDDMRGFYRSIYVENGREMRLAATRFKDRYARRFIPCFDYPENKANFTLKVRHNVNMSIESNMKKVGSSERDGDFRITTFEKSPPMSTYMLALVVHQLRGKYQAIDDKASSMEMWIICRSSLENHMNDALSNAFEAVRIYFEKFQYSYRKMVNKLNIIAIPDLAADGASAQPGLTIIREELLTNAPEKTTFIQKYKSSVTTAHEMSHIWFGDILSVERWNYLWMNEGFATFFQYSKAGEMYQEVEFVVGEMNRAMEFDMRSDTHSLTQTGDNGDIPKFDDVITYAKGAAVLRMISHHMGQNNFTRALRGYIVARALLTVSPVDIRIRFSNWTSNVNDFSNIFYSFTLYAGVPIVSVRMTPARDRAYVSQKNSANNMSNYTIPLTFVTKLEHSFSNTETRTILPHSSNAKIRVRPILNEWIIFNVKRVGYYRVNYDPASWRLIFEGLKRPFHDEIHVINRIQIIDDAMALAQAGELEYSLAFQMLDYLGDEVEYGPWTTALKALRFLYTRIPERNKNVIKKFILKRTEKVYKHLGFYPRDRDYEMDRYQREELLLWLCFLGQHSCVIDARNEFSKFSKGKYLEIPVDIRLPVMCVGIRHRYRHTFNEVWNLYVNENIETEKQNLLRALACTNLNGTMRMFYNNLFFANSVRKHIRVEMFLYSLTQNEKTADHAWNFLMNYHTRLSNETVDGYKDVAIMIGAVAQLFQTQKQLTELESFIGSYGKDFGNHIKILEESEKKLKRLLEWDEKNIKEILDVIEYYNKNGSLKTAKNCLLFQIFIIVIFTLTIY
ncbi:Aminopeptidase [Sergentomyia squamirostris]